jgi:hypothetical protein
MQTDPRLSFGKAHTEYKMTRPAVSVLFYVLIAMGKYLRSRYLVLKGGMNFIGRCLALYID